jgi:hypothetical protein
MFGIDTHAPVDGRNQSHLIEHKNMFSGFFNIQRQIILRQSQWDLQDERNRRREEDDIAEAERMRHRLKMAQAMVIDVANAKKAAHERQRLASARKEKGA